ncbi:MAG: hypothetical protein KatS3mg113_0597 [Planctomycetaceae bacterium]|nr:MAG: hypothetical protein KatS3mg113_0597 [Planctomycetaceae bacterium]
MPNITGIPDRVTVCPWLSAVQFPPDHTDGMFRWKKCHRTRNQHRCVQYRQRSLQIGLALALSAVLAGLTWNQVGFFTQTHEESTLLDPGGDDDSLWIAASRQILPENKLQAVLESMVPPPPEPVDIRDAGQHRVTSTISDGMFQNHDVGETKSIHARQLLGSGQERTLSEGDMNPSAPLVWFVGIIEPVEERELSVVPLGATDLMLSQPAHRSSSQLKQPVDTTPRHIPPAGL